MLGESVVSFNVVSEGPPRHGDISVCVRIHLIAMILMCVCVHLFLSFASCSSTYCDDANLCCHNNRACMWRRQGRSATSSLSASSAIPPHNLSPGSFFSPDMQVMFRVVSSSVSPSSHGMLWQVGPVCASLRKVMPWQGVLFVFNKHVLLQSPKQQQRTKETRVLQVLRYAKSVDVFVDCRAPFQSI